MSKYLRSQFVFSIVIRVIVLLLLAVNIKLYSNSLTLTELGEYFIILTYSYLINSLIFVPCDYYLQKEFLSEFKLGKIQEGAFFIINLLFAYILVLILVVLVLTYFELYPFRKSIAIGLLSIPIFLITTLRNILNNLFLQKIVNISFLVEGILKVTLLAILLKVKFTEPKSALVLSLLLSGFITVLFLLKKFPLLKSIDLSSFKFEIRSVLKPVMNFFPLSVSAALLLIQTQGYRVIYNNFNLDESVGLYSTTTNIGTVITGAIFIIINQYLHPQIYKNNRQSTRVFALLALPLLFCGVLILYFLSKYITTVILSPTFDKMAYLMIYGMLVDGLVQLNGVLTIQYSLKNKNSSLMIIYLIATILLGVCFVNYKEYFLNFEYIGVILSGTQLFIFISLLINMQYYKYDNHKTIR